MCHRFSRWWQPLNLDRLQKWVVDGRIDVSQVVTMKDLRDSGAVHKNVKDGVKLLATVSTCRRLNSKKSKLNLRRKQRVHKTRPASTASSCWPRWAAQTGMQKLHVLTLDILSMNLRCQQKDKVLRSCQRMATRLLVTMTHANRFKSRIRLSSITKSVRAGVKLLA